MADRNQMVTEFESVTGANEERARFYLESAGWELHIALSSFYDTDAESPEAFSQIAEEPPAVPSQQSERSTRQTPSTGRYATIASLHKEDSSSDSEEEGQAFYAGGSERSGQQILGPKKKANPDKITKAIFDAAKRQGAESVEDEEDTTKQERSRAFQGAGFRLGSDEDTSQQVSASLNQTGRQETIRVTLKFWSNGFSIDDGPLRSFDDPNNKAFLGAVERGEIPEELHRHSQGGEVHVNVEDHRGEEFVQCKPKVKAFAGAGHMLGSPTPNLAPAQPSTSSDPRPPPPSNVHLDESQPITTLQIRLADGTRLVAKFNHTSTVADLRDLVQKARPSTGDNFILMTTFPNKELTDNSQTLVQANLLNAVIVQRRK